MPSRRLGVTLELRYWRTGAPCGTASVGIVKPGSGCAEAAREVDASPARLRIGVEVLGGKGEGALFRPAGAVELTVAVAVGGIGVEDEVSFYVELEVVGQRRVKIERKFRGQCGANIQRIVRQAHLPSASPWSALARRRQLQS